MAELKLIRKSQLLSILSCGKSFVQYQINKGLLPPPIRLGERNVAFLESEINKTIAAMAAGLSDKQIKTLIKKMILERKAINERLNNYSLLDSCL